MIQRYWGRSYRNLIETKLQFNQGQSVVLFGNNNNGKTNFLESISMVLTGNSPIQKDRRLTVNKESHSAVVGVSFEHEQQDYQLYVKVNKEGRRYISLNQNVVKTFRKIQSLVECYFFTADVIRLFQDSPDGRRHALDRYCSDVFSDYKTVYKSYQGVLKQRNKLLKSNEDPAVLEMLDQQLVLYAGKVVSYRLQGVQQIESVLKKMVETIVSFEIKTLSIRYLYTRLTDINQYESALKTQLVTDRNKELLLGYTLTGPHRDDFDISINEQCLFEYFSRGINRIVALLFNLSSIEMKHQFQNSILLLDDVFIELDDIHKQALISFMEKKAQIFYTTVLESDQKFFNHPKVIRIDEGYLNEVSE